MLSETLSLLLQALPPTHQLVLPLSYKSSPLRLGLLGQSLLSRRSSTLPLLFPLVAPISSRRPIRWPKDQQLELVLVQPSPLPSALKPSNESSCRTKSSPPLPT